MWLVRPVAVYDYAFCLHQARIQPDFIAPSIQARQIGAGINLMALYGSFVIGEL